ncbi:DNA starvation/stationary phase protection protein [Arthrobacter crusticola]|uniref:DNA starvation/stationary phase protection protein n=1 Tax=Arthrobacter crusticola TaxID=2547960 RepID=A0A4R5TUA8_9MICC|nr:DNA starvation/stationary phase protection protein [Arthrobacter crusticola]TDK24634.1 DNA starvation/stationary phase protection protein [Arthrobacter crusticola]
MKASSALTDNLQSVLVDLIELHLQGKQAHWNVVGKNFRTMHLQLDEIIDDARLFTDQLAERMRALHAVPDGRSATVASNTSIDQFPAGLVSTQETIPRVVRMLESAVQRMRDVHDQVDEEDPTTADILHGFIEKLEQYAWMVEAENMEPTTEVTEPARAASA